MSISSLLFTSRDSLLAHQTAIDVVGSNVANVNTPGYTRQRLVLNARGSVDVKGATVQIGVDINRLERVYDRYIDSQITEQQQNSNYSDTMLQGLQNLEVMLDDTNGNGINDQLNKFWSAWESISNNPGGKVERSDLISSAENLTGSINSYKQNLDTVSNDMNRNIADAVSQINDKAKAISTLNEKIIGMAGGDIGNKNVLLDKRTLAVNELAALVNITQFEDDNGSLNVTLSNGEPLVQGKVAFILDVSVDENGRSMVCAAGAPGESLNNALTKGKLGAYIELQTEIVPQYVDYLNQFTTTLVDRVNELHAGGYDAYNNTGEGFFTIADASNATGTIEVSSLIVADANRIACSASVSGDGEIAGKIAAVQDELLMDNTTSTLNSYVAAMVGQIGNQVANAETENDYQTLIMNQLDNQRESVSGVSIDEEMIQLIKYQMGYTAAGKLCTTVNEMLDTLMSLVD